MTAITNGSKTLAPNHVVFHPIGGGTSTDGSIRLESQLLFGPTRERLRAGEGLLWWGAFAVNDHLGLTVYASSEARIRVQILDLEYRVLAEECPESGARRVHAVVRQSGQAFFRVVNEGDKDELVLLQVAARGAHALARPRRRALLRKVLQSVTSWTGRAEREPASQVSSQSS